MSQCCGSMTFWCGSGSADPCLGLMDPDPDSDPDADPDTSFFIIGLQDANKKLICFLKVFLHITFLRYRYFYIIFQKDKKSKRTVNIKIFCLMIEGFGSGSIPLTNGPGSATLASHLRIFTLPSKYQPSAAVMLSMVSQFINQQRKKLTETN